MSGSQHDEHCPSYRNGTSTLSGYALSDCHLFKTRSKNSLAKKLGISRANLDFLLKAKGNYNCWKDSKPNGKTRWISEPKPLLKQVQQRIHRLISRVKWPSYLMSTVKGTHPTKNALCHAGKDSIATTDVVSYFDSTPAQSLSDFFLKKLKCSKAVAKALTSLCTYRGHLPTGSPSSGILAFCANEPIWKRVAQYANDNRLEFTIYVDDLAISGAGRLDEHLTAIKAILSDHNLSSAKDNICNNSSGEITGSTVSKFGIRPKPSVFFKSYLTRYAQTGNSVDRQLQLDGKRPERVRQGLDAVFSYHRKIWG